MAGFSTGRPKPKGGAGVPAGMNQSGIFAGGPGGSGSGNAKSEAEKAAGTTGFNTRGAQAGRTAGGAAKTGLMGSGVVKDQWVGKGKDKKYVQVPKPNDDRGKGVTPSYADRNRSAAAAGVDAGTSRNAPKRTQKTATTPQDQGTSRGTPTRGDGSTSKAEPTTTSTTTSASAASASGKSAASQTAKANDAKAKKVPAVPGSLNFFMKKAAAAGDKNVKNRAYQMWKNSKADKKPAGMNVKDLPKNPKAGDEVKGARGVTWTWTGSNWKRGKGMTPAGYIGSAGQ
jgi:hypothetical protein